MTEASARISADANYFARIGAWLGERFPPANGILSLVLFFAVAAVMQPGGHIFTQWTNWLGGVLLWGHFFVLRIFDEHKDYETDLRNYPERVIQSGVVRLGEIRRLGYIVVAAQIAFSCYRGGGVGFPLYAWAAMFGYTCLMGAEFFLGEWLQKRLLVYAATHMLVMPLMAIWSAALAGAAVFDARVVVLALLFFCAGFAYEVFRKIRAPEGEIAGIDTYSSILGFRLASVLAFAFTTGFWLCALALLPWQRQQHAALAALAIFAALHLYLAYKLIAFCRRPSVAGARGNDKLSGLYVVLLLGTLIAVAA